MGVTGTGGGGAAGAGYSGTAVAAAAAILLLLALLCCYVCYFFISKIRELSRAELSTATPSTPAKRREPAYPVQPVVREGATAMAALCRQLPRPQPQPDQVFPSGRSPDPRPALTSPPAGSPVGPHVTPQVAHDKVPEAPPSMECRPVTAK